MALTLQNRILNQVVDNTVKYFYLYEPLPVLVNESDLEAREVLIDLSLVDSTGTVIETFTEYATYDLNPGNPLNFDLMDIVQQAHNADVWRVSSINDIINGENMIVDKNIYSFRIYSDSDTEDEILISILPILGGRRYVDFEPLVSNTFPINEFEKYEVDISTRWIDYPTITTSLNTPSATGARVVFSQNTNLEGECPCAGMLYWKSRLGGWMQWGFDIKNEKSNKKYENNIQVGMFKTPRNIVGSSPYIPTDYTKVTYKNTITVKSLSLNYEELQAVDSISQAPVCYYMKEPGARLELMRITNSTVPLNSLANGGDFSVSLQSISSTEFKTR